MARLLTVGLLIIAFHVTTASNGDRSDYFRSCFRICTADFCSTETDWFIDGRPRQLYDKLVHWTCRDECSYECMWQATNAFHDRGWPTPQFFGKWPFARVWGIQEPASAIFSLMNLMANIFMIRRFRKKVRRDSPNYWVWQIFGWISVNAWLWSIVFHTRDLPITELFDYGFAYSMVLAMFVCMILRMMHKRSLILRGVVAICGVLWFLHYFKSLSARLDYQFNMKANIFTGIVSGVGWLLWYMTQRRKRKYAWKVLAFQLGVACSLILEVNDFPPILHAFDAHSLWHLSSLPLTVLLFEFVIDDCCSLRTEKYEPLLTLPEVSKEDKKSF